MKMKQNYEELILMSLQNIHSSPTVLLAGGGNALIKTLIKQLRNAEKIGSKFSLVNVKKYELPKTWCILENNHSINIFLKIKI